MYCKGWEYEINTKGFHLGHGYLKLGSWIYATDLVKSHAPLWSKHLFCLRSCPSLHFFLILLSLDGFFCPPADPSLIPHMNVSLFLSAQRFMAAETERGDALQDGAKDPTFLSVYLLFSRSSPPPCGSWRMLVTPSTATVVGQMTGPVTPLK